MAIAAADFAKRMERELETFSQVHEDGGITNTIPSIFSYWASRYLSPRLREVFGEHDINMLFASEIAERALLMGKTKNLTCLSLGSGDCSAEFDIARKVLDKGVQVNITCTDINPKLMAYSRTKAAELGLAAHFAFEAFDVNTDFPEHTYDVVFVNHALHHFIELEWIFEKVVGSINDGGCFIVSDMIGRNGHMRWPEALKWVEALWRLLPDAKKINHFTKNLDEPYINFDCSDGNFEGIRAQDIMPLLLKHFTFEKFVGLGNIIDVFIDRIYGHNFSPDNAWDVAFIDFVEALNTEMIDAGAVKPTALFATLVKKSDASRKSVYSRWSPEFCLRVPD